MASIEFLVPGKPIAWARAGARAGLTSDGRPFVRHFTKDSQRPYAALLRDAAIEAIRKQKQSAQQQLPWSTQALAVHIEATYVRPPSHFTTTGALRKGAPYRRVGKPDIDNLTKMVGDALNGVLWNDDSQIVRCTTYKEWGKSDDLRILVVEITWP